MQMHYSLQYGSKKIYKVGLIVAAAVFAMSLASTRSSTQAVNYECAPRTVYTPTGSGTVRTVNNDGELAIAMSAAAPGDTINLNTGNYSEINYTGGSHASGTSGNPIVFQAGAGQSPVLTGVSGYTGVGVNTEGKDYIIFSGFEIRNKYDGMAVRDADNVIFEYSEVHAVGGAGIVAQAVQGNSSLIVSNITIRCNEIHDTGNISAQYGEGIYLGNGTNFSADHDILVEKNEIYDVTADGMDIKALTYNITVQDNYIHDIDFDFNSYGRGIALAGNDQDYSDGNYLIQRNLFANIASDRDSDAIALLIGHGTATVRNNLFYNIEDRAIYLQSTGGGFGFGNSSTADVHIYNNTLYGCGTVGCVQDLSGGIANITQTNNLMTADATGADRTATSADFGTPLTGTADSGDGPGSAFMLVPASGAVDSAATIGSFSGDIDGTSRPSGSAWDFGAYEYVASGGSNAAPVITSSGGAATAAVSVAENQTAITAVTETDADGSDTHTYTLTGGADQTDFSIGSTSGVLTFNSAPDFEIPTDTGTNNTYEVEVTVTDNGSPVATDMQTITVTVTDVAESSGTTYYVSPGGSGVSTNSGSPGDVSSSIAQMCASSGTVITGGDSIVFMDGTYNTADSTVNTDGRTIVIANKNCGDAVNFIELRAQNKHQAIININYTGPADDAGGFQPEYSSYIRIKDFFIEGNQSAGQKWGVGVQPDSAHHIEIIGNHIEDVVGGGVQTQNSTHIRVEDNDFTRNAFQHPFCASNISFNLSENPLNYPNDSDGYANYVINNRAYSSENLNAADPVYSPDCFNSLPSDGNCIIIDVSNELGDYSVRTLVANNVCADNGGRGIQALGSSHIDFFNNTVYQNTQTNSDWAEVGVTCDNRDFTGSLGAQDIRIEGNIIWKKAGSKAFRIRKYNTGNNCPITGISIKNNIIVSDDLSNSDVPDAPSAIVTTTNPADLDNCGGANLINVTPAQLGLINPTLFLATGDFHLSAGSVAIDRGCENINYDREGSSRPQDGDGTGGNYSDVGAYEFAGAAPANAAPVITSSGGAATAAVSVAENQTAVTTVTETDADGSDAHTYTLTGGVDQTDFSIGSTSGVLTFNSAPNYEVPTDTGTNNTYVVDVTVTDNGSPVATDMQTITVTITNINAAPSSLALDSSTIPAALTGAGSGIGDLSASDDGEDTGTLTYSLVAGTGDTGNASFQIGGASNDELQTSAALSAATYSIRVNVSDGVNDVASVFSITVQAGSDVVAPTISYSGANPISLTVGDAYSAPSVTASDVIDGNLTSSIVVAGDTVAVDGSGNVSTAGSYTLTYNVSDTASNAATQLSVLVNVAAASGGGGSGDGGSGSGGGAPSADDDNISDEVEDASPNSGDNNGDGTKDSTQSNVSTAPNAAVDTNVNDSNNNLDASSSNPSRYVSLQLPSEATVTNFTIVKEETGDKQDEGYDYPLGLFDFTATVPTGSTQEIVIYLDQQYDTSDWIWRKYDTSSSTYTTVDSAVFGEATVDSVVLTTVTYSVTDGGTLDQDNEANGTIVDPAGPAVLAASDGSGSTESLEDTGVGVSLIVIAGSALALVVMTMATTKRRVVYMRR